VIIAFAGFRALGFYPEPDIHITFIKTTTGYMSPTTSWTGDIDLSRLNEAFRYHNIATKLEDKDGRVKEAWSSSPTDFMNDTATAKEGVPISGDEKVEDLTMRKKTHRGCRAGRKNNKALM
jgi:hypothetical protein